MLPFWFLYCIPALGFFANRRFAPSARSASWWMAGLLLTLAIGLRHRVGGDWFAYLAYLQRAASMTFQEVLLQGDPGFYLLNWLIAGLGGGIYAVNLACGALFMSGILVFARRQPLPWLALLVSVPYLVIVVGMGYTRQAVALGFVLLGLAALADGRSRLGSNRRRVPQDSDTNAAGICSSCQREAVMESALGRRDFVVGWLLIFV